VGSVRTFISDFHAAFEKPVGIVAAITSFRKAGCTSHTALENPFVVFQQV
jgi:hypothetical protein